MRRFITKKQALSEFTEIWKEIVLSNPNARGDSILKREEFNNFVDCLEKDRRITATQAYNWSNPF